MHVMHVSKYRVFTKRGTTTQYNLVGVIKQNKPELV